MSYNTVKISFRNAIDDILSTTYGIFGVYRYPAKFIPQIIFFILKKYLKRSQVVFDPFAGFGTVGFSSRIFGNPYVLWDLNPILTLIHDVLDKSELNVDINKIIEYIKSSNTTFIPKWSNVKYWFPEEFLFIISKSWGAINKLEEGERYLFLIPLLKTTKYFSYTDEKVHKLYKSKFSKVKIDKLRSGDYENLFFDYLKKETVKLKNSILDYYKLNPFRIECEVRSGVDINRENLDKVVDVLITSPPYLQAQEYIRSTKMELFWLGYDEEYIKYLSNKEIPYCKVEPYDVKSGTYFNIRKNISELKLLRLYDGYFNSLLSVFTRLGNNVSDYMFIFVGRAKIRSIEVPIDIIITEHLENFGWKHEVTYVDEIVSRVMFKVSENPSTGLSDNRIKSEYLIVLKR